MKRYKKSDKEFRKLIKALNPKSKATRIFRIRPGKIAAKLWKDLDYDYKILRKKHMVPFRGLHVYKQDQDWLVSDTLWRTMIYYKKEYKAWKNLTYGI